VFEDGVEQTISSFAVENAGVGSVVPATARSEPPPAAGGVTPAPPPAQARPAPRVVRRTYLICIDSLNSKFANIVHVRAALLKLFAAEPAGDAQYMVVAMGARTQVMQGLKGILRRFTDDLSNYDPCCLEIGRDGNALTGLVKTVVSDASPFALLPIARGSPGRRFRKLPELFLCASRSCRRLVDMVISGERGPRRAEATG
jgi:hypothetical protein